MHLSSAIPWGGGPRANTALYGDLHGGLNDHFTLHVGEMREVWFLKALQPGENRGLRKRNRSISSCLTSTT